MKIIHKNKKEDIKLLIDLGADYHGEDIVLTFSAGQYGLNKFVCSYVGGVQTNCVVNNSTVLCLLDNHGLSLGMLSVEIDIRVPDTQMPDGDFRHVTHKIASFVLGGEECSLELTNGASDYFPEELVPESVINLLPTVIKGEPGKDADIEGCNKAIAAMVALTTEVEMSESKRAEAEQQRMDSEAKRIAVENERKTAENERAEAETQRAEAETLRTEADDTRTEAENLRITKEAERTKAETARQEAENLRVSNETKRTESEAARSEAENTRATAETLRANDEKLRAYAEKQRIVNENERKEAETARVNAEALRANDETSRINTETIRAEAERQRAAAEAARQTAESSRDEAETIRQQNETAREQAETLRAEAEVERQQAENIRKQKESERQEAEQERIVNNENCVTATNAALKAAQEAKTAANTVMQVADRAEAEANKATAAATAAATASNSALNAAADAVTASSEAKDAASSANEAATRANSASEGIEVYDERISAVENAQKAGTVTVRTGKIECNVMVDSKKVNIPAFSSVVVRPSTRFYNLDYIFKDGSFVGCDFRADTTNWTSMSNMFRNFGGLDIDVSNLNTSQVTDMSAMFQYDKYLISLDLGSFDTSQVTNMSGMFEGLSKFTGTLDIRHFNMSKVTSLYNFIRNSTAKLNMEGCDTSKVTTIRLWNESNLWQNLVGLDFSSVSGANKGAYRCMPGNRCPTIVGDYTLDDVRNNNLYTYRNFGYSMDWSFLGSLNVQSFLAVINGLKDLTGQDSLTLTLPKRIQSSLTDDDIAKATDKNWTIIWK